MIINAAAIQKLREDAAGNEGAALASFAGIQNGRECRQNEIFAENGVRFSLKAEAERKLAALLESGWPHSS
jgi:hypothetical protein